VLQIPSCPRRQETNVQMITGLLSMSPHHIVRHLWTGRGRQLPVVESRSRREDRSRTYQIPSLQRRSENPYMLHWAWTLCFVIHAVLYVYNIMLWCIKQIVVLLQSLVTLTTNDKLRKGMTFSQFQRDLRFLSLFVILHNHLNVQWHSLLNLMKC